MTTSRIPHRRQHLHRLQGLRGCLQGMERSSRRRHGCGAAFSYDNTQSLGASTWRHVLFLEQPLTAGPQIADTQDPFRWVFLSDVCKHCANAGCLEACPTGSIVRTECRLRLCATRCLQWLRILRGLMPVRRDRQAARRWPRIQMHVLLRPAESRPDPRVRQSLSDAIDSIRSSRRTSGARKEPRARIAGTRIRGCAAVRSAGNQRRRYSRHVCNSGRAGKLQSSAGARGSHHLFEKRMDLGAAFRRSCFRNSVCSICTLTEFAPELLQYAHS